METAFSFSLSTGTSVKDFLRVSRKVPPGGYAVVAIVSDLFRIWENGGCCRRMGWSLTRVGEGQLQPAMADADWMNWLTRYLRGGVPFPLS